MEDDASLTTGEARQGTAAAPRGPLAAGDGHLRVLIRPRSWRPVAQAGRALKAAR